MVLTELHIEVQHFYFSALLCFKENLYKVLNN